MTWYIYTPTSYYYLQFEDNTGYTIYFTDDAADLETLIIPPYTRKLDNGAMSTNRKVSRIGADAFPGYGSKPGRHQPLRETRKRKRRL